jgi:hypothetical protein
MHVSNARCIYVDVVASRYCADLQKTLLCLRCIYICTAHVEYVRTSFTLNKWISHQVEWMYQVHATIQDYMEESPFPAPVAFTFSIILQMGRLVFGILSGNSSYVSVCGYCSSQHVLDMYEDMYMKMSRGWLWVYVCMKACVRIWCIILSALRHIHNCI